MSSGNDRETTAPSYVYLIAEIPFPDERTDNWTKIGYTQNRPEWRMDANLKRGNPRTIRVARCYEFTTSRDARDAERKAHQQFSDARYEREWFHIEWQEVDKWATNEGWIARIENTTD